MNDNKTTIIISITIALTVCFVSYFGFKSNVHKEQQETERALKQDKKTTIDFGFGKKEGK